MKPTLILLIINLTFCLKAEKSSFDMQGNPLIFSLAFLFSMIPIQKVQDLNKDGFPDLISAAIFDSSGAVRDGSVYIFNGSANGISFSSVSQASKTISGTASSTEAFGTTFY